MGRRKMDSELHRIKLETGTVYQTSKGGNYYFRYQINGERKCVSLKTANQEEAIRKARELLPIVQATNPEVIATHVKIARKMAAQIRSLPVSKIWETYANHPNRALPATVREQLSYEATLEELSPASASLFSAERRSMLRFTSSVNLFPGKSPGSRVSERYYLRRFQITKQ